MSKKAHKEQKHHLGCWSWIIGVIVFFVATWVAAKVFNGILGPENSTAGMCIMMVLALVILFPIVKRHI